MSSPWGLGLWVGVEGLELRICSLGFAVSA